jgi:formate-dependent nitrite reductase membrane component NrfD
MAWGTWILTLFIIFGFAYSLPAFRAFAWLPWGQQVLGIGIIAALFSILVTAYSGLVLGVVKGIPFWNTAVLPLLFLLSGLYTGIAIILVVSLFHSTALGMAGFYWLGIAGIVLILLHLIILGSHVEIARRSSTAAAESVHQLMNPLFIGVVIIAGLIVPLGLLIYSLGVSSISALTTLVGISGILILIGGLFQRYSIIRAGVFTPLYSGPASI